MSDDRDDPRTARGGEAARQQARRGPVLIEDDAGEPASPPLSPAEAPPVPDTVSARPRGQAMRTMAALAARRPSRLARWFWRLLGALIAFGVSVLTWRAVAALIATYPLLGYAALALTVAFLSVCVAIIVREAAALARLGRLDHLGRAAEAALRDADLKAARRVTGQLSDLYAGREALSWGRDRLAERQGDVFDAEALLHLAEAELLAPLDDAARAEVEAAARQVATVTAIVPLALADVATALTSNLRMIRRIAEIYGGRGGTLGSLRLIRAVMTHLVATGAVAVGDDLVHTVAGGSVLSRLSRRFGEGLVNGALTARVGVAAMEVCRPLPFSGRPRPSVTGIIRRALTGLFPAGRDEDDADR
ncbi:TIGR01620 family protein [Mesobaculum littorinae]|uniref:TIGR01620 family protein n=1 Tax=Mesobaculum littorinae TaxID=2486419 RepID=A0A438AIH7_9RHOB|nr:TIGR01620 family protein [Mesobaculum littorinae]RVV98482.1 TIGR01620 family protein [Mesobaculum littorinae]